MGKVKTFAILYNRPTYSCGELVSGRIVVELTEQIEVKLLKIHAKGHAFVRWTEGHAGSTSNHTRVYTQERRFFKHDYLLTGTASEKSSLYRLEAPRASWVPCTENVSTTQVTPRMDRLKATMKACSARFCISSIHHC
ncbi:arrestin domain-containing protein 3-like [Mobula hypostoma]|uniref:arrestin domain-containing protein 3-like n=1 Tax=Mobula hypostoma TaxID=723540 RepID=UPI002FC3B4A8